MSAPAFRCAVEAEVRGDSMIGTAPPQTRVLLVHQPGPWGPRGLVESRCDATVAHRIDAAAAKAGMRMQTIRRPGKHEIGKPARGYHVGIATTGVRDASISWWLVDDLAEIADDLERGFPQRAPVAIDTEPLYLVCAHGRHDACCALRGRPVARALQDVRPGRVWETTHLGGDRFAANLLVLPTGVLYGRVPPALAATLAERTDAGEVVPSLMRGRIGLSPVAQAALIYAQTELHSFALDALRVGAVRDVDADLKRVTIASPNGSYVVTVAVETRDAAQLTCRGVNGAKARQYRGVSLRADAVATTDIATIS